MSFLIQPIADLEMGEKLSPFGISILFFEEMNLQSLNFRFLIVYYFLKIHFYLSDM